MSWPPLRSAAPKKDKATSRTSVSRLAIDKENVKQACADERPVRWMVTMTLTRQTEVTLTVMMFMLFDAEASEKPPYPWNPA